MVKLPTTEEMLKAGMHFGHRTSKWHPKMEPFIFTSRNGIHILDLSKSRRMLKKALDYIEKTAAEDKTILLVGTKSQVKDPLKKIAAEVGVSYVNEGWLGGALTNFAIIRKAIKKYRTLLEEKETGKLDKYTKKERVKIDKEIDRLEKKVGGLANMTRTPDVIFIWDIREEKTALTEAKKMGIPVIAICDTNVNPDPVDYVIPANDDATKTIKLVLGLIGDAIKEGKAKVKPQATRQQAA